MISRNLLTVSLKKLKLYVVSLVLRPCIMTNTAAWVDQIRDLRSRRVIFVASELTPSGTTSVGRPIFRSASSLAAGQLSPVPDCTYGSRSRQSSLVIRRMYRRLSNAESRKFIGSAERYKVFAFHSL